MERVESVFTTSPFALYLIEFLHFFVIIRSVVFCLYLCDVREAVAHAAREVLASWYM